MWTWTALDADTKLMVTYFVGDRGRERAYPRRRSSRSHRQRSRPNHDGRPQRLSRAIEEAFGGRRRLRARSRRSTATDPAAAAGRYSPPICTGVKKHVVEGDPDRAHVSTSYVERANLSIRMQNRRFTRLTNAFSKKFENHVHALALYFMFYNFVRVHKTLAHDAQRWPLALSDPLDDGRYRGEDRSACAQAGQARALQEAGLTCEVCSSPACLTLAACAKAPPPASTSNPYCNQVIGEAWRALKMPSDDQTEATIALERCIYLNAKNLSVGPDDAGRSHRQGCRDLVQK